MGVVSLDILFIIFLSGGLLPVLGLWFYYDWRDGVIYEGERLSVIFHCIKCDQIYSAKDQIEVLECPRCQFRNSRLRF